MCGKDVACCQRDGEPSQCNMPKNKSDRQGRLLTQQDCKYGRQSGYTSNQAAKMYTHCGLRPAVPVQQWETCNLRALQMYKESMYTSDAVVANSFTHA